MDAPTLLTLRGAVLILGCMLRAIFVLLIAFRVTICPLFCAIGAVLPDQCGLQNAVAQNNSGIESEHHCCNRCQKPCAGENEDFPLTPTEDSTPCRGDCACKVLPDKGDRSLNLDLLWTSFASTSPCFEPNAALTKNDYSTVDGRYTSAVGRLLRISHSSLLI